LSVHHTHRNIKLILAILNVVKLEIFLAFLQPAVKRSLRAGSMFRGLLASPGVQSLD
jgi:hypothetical protein